MQKSSWKKKLTRIGAVVLSLGAIGSVVTYVRANRKVEAPYTNIHASTAPVVIERGR